MKKKACLLFFLIAGLCLSGDVVYSEDMTINELMLDDHIRMLIEKAPKPEDFPSVSAVYLLMEENDYVNEAGTATYEMHVILKIMDKRAIALGEVKIPYDSSDSVLEINAARTIRPDNTVVEVEPGGIRTLDPYLNFPLYSSIKLKQFSMPSVEVGCVIEYKATLRAFKPKMPNFFWSYWSFPLGTPVAVALLKIDIPDTMKIEYLARNLDVKPEIRTQPGRKIYRWVTTGVYVGGIYERLLPPHDTVCPSLTFATARTWDEMARWFAEIAYRQTAPSQKMKDYADSVIKSKGGNRPEIAKEFYNFVSRDVRYVYIPLETSSYQPHRAIDVFKNKYGDCKDKSSLLISLCRMANINAYFALLKTRSAGRIVTEFPALDFNHCIVALPKKGGGYVFLDPTMELNRFGYMPTELQGVDILVVKKDGHEFVKLPFEKEDINGTESQTEMRINDDYTISISEETILHGEDEINARMGTKYSTEKGLRAFLGQVAQTMYTKVELSEIDFSNPEDLSEPFRLSLSYEVKDHIKDAGKLLIFDLPSNRVVNPLSSEERKHPVWLPTLTKREAVVNITIPAKCKVNYLPTNADTDTPFASFKRDVSSSGNKITIKQQYKTKMLEIAPDQYKEYKAFVDNLNKLSKESIVLEKI